MSGELLKPGSSSMAQDFGHELIRLSRVLDEPDLLSVFGEVLPLLEMYLKFQRQFDRFVQLDRQLNTPPSPAVLSFAGKSEEASEESRI